MKYSDMERVKKIYEYTTKLYDYIKNNDVTKEKLLNDYTLQWLVTTPLYNIGEQTYYLSSGIQSTISEYIVVYDFRTQA